MNINEEIYLEHFGVKGQKWGVRKTRKVQNALDRTNRIAKGKASPSDKILIGLTSGRVTKKSAARGLRRGAALQKRINDGDSKVQEILLKATGIRIKELNYHQN